MRRKFGHILRRAIERLGITVIPNWRISRIDEERHLRRLLAYLDVDCVFDVGANVGQYGRLLREQADFKGLIISFEPNPAALPELRSIATRYGRWEVEPFALGDVKRTAPFHAYELSDLGSLRRFDPDSAFAPASMHHEIMQMQVETLSDYFPRAQERLQFKRPFLKMDTQGFDVDVARGAGSILRQFVGLQSEISFHPIYAGSPNYKEAIEFYSSAGFELSRIVPIHDVHFPRLVEMDVIMLRSPHLNPEEALSSGTHRSL